MRNKSENSPVPGTSQNTTLRLPIQAAKLCITVLILALLAADFGLRFSMTLACEPNAPANYSGGGSEAGKAYRETVTGGTIKVLNNQQDNGWCNQVLQEQENLIKWMPRLFDVSVTDILLVIFTLGLVYVGYLTDRTHDRQREIMARQAEIQARAMTITEEPKLILSSLKFLTPFGDECAGIAAEYGILIAGKTKPDLVAYFHEIYLAEFLPRQPDQNQGWNFVSALDREAVYISETVRNVDELSEADVDFLKYGRGAHSDKRQLFLVARWVYNDIFGNQHEYGFCYRGGRKGGPGLPYGGAVYNYRRIRKPEEQL